MRLAYSLLLTVAAVALLPFFLFRWLVKRRSMGGLWWRLGLGLPGIGESGGRPTIWLHAVSVGEVLAARPLCRALRVRYPNGRLIVSTTTETGREVARREVPEADGVIHYPLDWSFAVRRLLNHIEPELVILMESELWLNFLSECRVRSIPVVVVNGRISDRSFRRSRRVRWLVSRLYGLVTRMAMQTEEDAERARRLGAAAEAVSVSGNLKYDVGLSSGQGGAVIEVLRGLEGARLLVAGSTHRGEEAIVIDAFERLRGMGYSGLRLLIAPRHPERFGEVGRLIASRGLIWVARSTAGASEEIRGAEVILLDTIGELAMVYRLAEVVLVGGSLAPIGGHNILEPALAGRPVIVGPHMENFREMAAEFERREALIRLPGGSAEEQVGRLAEAWRRLLDQPAEARAAGERARRTVEANRGATERTVALVSQLLAKG